MQENYTKHPGKIKSFVKNNFYDLRGEEDAVQRAVNRAESRRRNMRPDAFDTLEVTKQTVVVNGRDKIRLTVWFTSPSGSNLGGAFVWVKGYGTGNILGGTTEDQNKIDTLAFQQYARVNQSPCFLDFEVSGEKVILGVEAINPDGLGSGLDTMPTQILVLD